MYILPMEVYAIHIILRVLNRPLPCYIFCFDSIVPTRFHAYSPQVYSEHTLIQLQYLIRALD